MSSITATNDGTISALNIATPTDADGDVLIITVDQLPIVGQGIVQLADGSPLTVGQTLSISELEGLTFQPQPNAVGAAGAFIYTVDDGQGGTDSQTITFNISDVIVLREGANFTTTVERSVDIPSETAELRFTYSDLLFDTTDPNFINDAFEAALVDETGASLVHTIGDNQDAFFNLTEGELPNLANGVSLSDQTVTVNLVGLSPGTSATLLLRLVNTDTDTTTSIRITEITVDSIIAGPPSGITPTEPLPVDADTIDFAVLENVSASFASEYGQTSFNEASERLFAEVIARNDGQYEVDGPILLAINNLSDPSVRVVGADGVTPEGLPYFRLDQSSISPGETTQQIILEFGNPNKVQFSYDVVFLGDVNDAPQIITDPLIEGAIGQLYQYDVDAVDPEGDTLTYALVVAPEEMTIDTASGLIQWNPVEADRGSQSITVQVTDGRGGVTEQTYDLVVGDAPPNRPPVFTTSPVVDARVNTEYLYDADATDLDLDVLNYALLAGPQGMAIDEVTGELSWRPTASQVAGGSGGQYEVSIQVSDTQGGEAVQTYVVNVLPEEGNNAPVIVSEPVTQINLSNELGLPDVINTFDTKFDWENAVGGTENVVALSFSNAFETNLLKTNDPDLSAYYAELGVEFQPFANGDYPQILRNRISEKRGGNSSDDGILSNTFTSNPPGQGNHTIAAIFSVPVYGVGLFTNDRDGGVVRIYDEFDNLIATDDVGNSGTVSSNFGGLISDRLIKRVEVEAEFDGDFRFGIYDFQFVTASPDDLSGSYTYDVDAIDPDNDSLTYDLLDSPEGMEIDPVTGVIQWQPNQDQLGLQEVVVQVADGRGGLDEQQFIIEVESPEIDLAVNNINFNRTSEDANPTTSYTDQAEFLNAVETTIPFEGFESLTTGNPGTLINTTNFQMSSASLQVRNSPQLGSFATEGTQFVRWNSTSNQTLTFTFENPINIFGVTLTDGADNPAATLSLSTSAGDNFPSFLAGEPDGVSRFFGVINPNSTFDTVTITSNTADGLGLDQVYFSDAAATPLEGELSAQVINLGDTDINQPFEVLFFGDENSNQAYDVGIDTLLSRTTTTQPLLAGELLTITTNYVGDSDLLEAQIGSFVDSQNVIAETNEANNVAFYDPSTNRPPIFITEPIANAYVDTLYSYDSDAVDLDNDELTYALIEGPEGMEIDGSTGVLSWTATSEDISGNTSSETDPTLPSTPGFDVEIYADVVFPVELDFDPAGTLYVGSSETFDRIYRIAPGGNVVEEYGADLLSDPDAVLFDGTGQISGIPGSVIVGGELARPNGQLSAISPDDQSITQLFEGNIIGNVTSVVKDSADRLLFSNSVTGDVVVVDENGPRILFTPPSGSLLAVNDQDHIFAAGSDGVIRIYGADGQLLDDDFSIGLGAAPALAFGPGGVWGNDLYAMTQDGELIRIDTAGDQETIGTGFSLSSYPDLAFGPDNALYLPGQIDNTDRILRISPNRETLGLEPNQFPVTITVADGQGGVDVQNYILNVQETPTNSEPVFTSTPLVAASVNQRFRYDADAQDVDGDPLTYDLSLAPEGMGIDPNSGIVFWEPTITQIGIHDVIVRVQDGNGGVDLQAFQVTVNNNRAPVITSRPVGPTIANTLYQYDVDANDADGDTLTYRLLANPDGVTIDSNTGLLSWTPTDGDVGGNFIRVQVDDGQGGLDTQSFTLPVIASGSVNNFPIIANMPRDAIGLGDDYIYQVEATDPDNDPLTFSLVDSPAGMTIDPTGRVVWPAASTQLGDYNFTIRVEDGRGAVTEATYSVSVVQQTTNTAPTITSTPSFVAAISTQYLYEAVATDPENDPIVWSLVSGPVGLALDETSGRVSWTPTVDQIGFHEVIIEAIDAQGASQQQGFGINVSSTNTPPIITSAPPTLAFGNQAYAYAVQASDVNGDPLVYSLTTAPEGLVIDETTGVIAWTPTPAQLGTQLVTVNVDDGRGGVATQSYTLNVAGDAPNQPPTINSRPAFRTTAGLSYTYQIEASDPENLTLTYDLIASPANMTIDPVTGLLSWSPTVDQVGPHTVQVAAFDPLGLGASQTYVLTVGDGNQQPVLNNTPETTALVNEPYAFDLNVTDPDGDGIQYQLVTGPAEMTIDALGRLRWTPTAADLGNQRVDLVIRDDRGAGLTFGYDLAVIADTTAPQVAIEVSQSQIDVGESVTVQVRAVDDVGVASIGLTVDGEAVALDPNGAITLSFDALGTVNLAATAIDRAGNEASDSLSVAVVDTNDVDAPIVSILSPAFGSEVTSFMDVVGTVTDDNLTSYTLTLTPFAGGPETVIATGNSEITANVLGQLDGTILRNDTYVLALTAEDAGGNIASTSTVVDVAGDLKIGNYTLSFVDLSIPLTGIPIVVSRTYDTLNTNISDDFGYGWSMDLRDTDLTDNVGRSGLEDSGIYNAFFDGAAIYVTLPNGVREKFIFQPQARGLFGLTTYKPRFVAADGDNTSTLTVDDIDLQRTADGRYVTLSQIPYNPASTLISSTSSGNYTLTTKDGIKYTIDGNTGDLEQITDRNGNTLTYTESGVFSSTGKQVTLERDPQGRITAVIDPEGNRIAYEYDDLGDLVAVTDREGNVTRMTYEEDIPHFLDDIIDPLGRNGGRAEYDEFGRLVEIIDINGNPVKLTHNVGESKEIITNLLGNQTVLVYDSRGNVVQEIDALGGITTRTYDDRDNMLTEADPLGNTTTFTYDNSNNVLTETDPLGNVTTSTYNGFNQVTTTTDAVGNTLSNTFDNRGNLIRQQDAAGNVSNFTYDSKGNLSTFTDAKGHQTAFEYDASGNLTRLVDPIGAENEFTYNETGNLTSFTDFRGNTSTFEYDAESRVVAITDPEGNVTRTEYNAVNEQTAIIDTLGRRTEQRYNDRGLLTETILPDATPEDLTDNPRTLREYDAGDRLISMTDEVGRVTRYVYDELDRLVETIYPDTTPDTLDDNPRMRSEYDAADRLIAEIDELGNRTEYEYDAADRLVLVRDALGHETRYTYDAADRLIETVNALGNATVNQYDVLNRLTQTIDALGNIASFTYDENDNLIATSDPNGNVSQSTYDDRDRLVTSTDAEGGVTTYEYNDNNNLISLTDARDNRTTFTYDNRNQLIAETDPFNNTTTYGYDPIGNLVTQTDRNNFQTRYEYDERNRLVRQIDPLGGITTNTYDANSNLIAQTDELGRITSYTYDERDRLVQTIDALNGVTTFDYDAANNLISQTDALEQTTTFAYDALNRQDSVTDALGHTTSYAFDANGNLTAITDALGRVTEFSYDPLDRLIVATDALGGTVTNTYDANGNLITVTDQLDRTTTFEYDGRNLQTKTIDPLGNTVTSEYDANGNLVTLTDGEGNSTTYEYDTLNRQTAILDALNNATRMTYDPEGNLLTFTDPEDNTTRYTYDALNRRTTDTNELGFSRTYTYDAVDNMIVSTDRNGRDHTYTYDSLNRLVQEQWLDETGASIETITSTYDAIGQLKSITDSNSANAFTYDAVGRQLSANNSGTPGIPSVLLEYTYDAVGNQLSVTDTIDGVTQGVETFSYDDLNRATQITQSGNGVADKRVDMIYDAASQMESLTRYSDLVGTQLVAETDYTYDDAGRLTELSHNQNGTGIATYTLDYDAANRITAITSPDGTATYDYDDISQLTGADYDFQGDESYSYDDNGNRTNAGYDVGPNNQLISDGTYIYTYDGEGNRTSQTHIATGEVTDYTFDHRNRLASIVTRDEDGTVTQVVENLYDAFDRRISIVVDTNADGTPDSTEKFVYDGSEITLVFDGDGNLTHRYLHGTDIDQILAEETADGTVLWPLTDHLGTIRDLLNPDGILANHITYNSFGRVTSETNPDLDFRFGYTGREIDEATGLMYYRARYYDPSTGQFISQDPLGFDAGDPNLYRYVFNSPLIATDPSGEFWLTLQTAIVNGISSGVRTIGAIIASQTFLSAASTLGSVVARGALLGIGFGAVNATLEAVEGSRTEFSLEDYIVELAWSGLYGGGFAGVLLVAPEAAVPLAIYGVRQGISSISQERYLSGGLNLLLSIGPFSFSKIRNPVVGEGTYFGQLRGQGKAIPLSEGVGRLGKILRHQAQKDAATVQVGSGNSDTIHGKPVTNRSGGYDPETNTVYVADGGHFDGMSRAGGTPHPVKTPGISMIETENAVFWANDSNSLHSPITQKQAFQIQLGIENAFPNKRVVQLPLITDLLKFLNLL